MRQNREHRYTWGKPFQVKNPTLQTFKLMYYSVTSYNTFSVFTWRFTSCSILEKIRQHNPVQKSSHLTLALSSSLLHYNMQYSFYEHLKTQQNAHKRVGRFHGSTTKKHAQCHMYIQYQEKGVHPLNRQWQLVIESAKNSGHKRRVRESVIPTYFWHILLHTPTTHSWAPK